MTLDAADELTELEVTSKLNQALVRDPHLSPTDINISVEDGTAVLKGQVETRFEKSWAEHLAGGTEGVKAVENQIEVEPGATQLLYDTYTYNWPAYQYTVYFEKPERTDVADQAIRESIEDELFWSPFVDEDDIRVEVTDGVALLYGVVDDEFEINTAIANGLEGGARYVKNRLKVDE